MKKHPNILFFGIDSLRSDHMSLYGYKRLTTPHIDAFIEDGGITFDKMYSPPSPQLPATLPCSRVWTASQPTA